MEEILDENGLNFEQVHTVIDLGFFTQLLHFPSLASHHAAHPRLPVSDEDGHQHHEATHRVVHEHRLQADSVQLLLTHCLRFTSPTHLKKTSKNLTVAQNLLSSDLRLRKPPNLLQSPR